MYSKAWKDMNIWLEIEIKVTRQKNGPYLHIKIYILDDNLHACEDKFLMQMFVH